MNEYTVAWVIAGVVVGLLIAMAVRGQVIGVRSLSRHSFALGTFVVQVVISLALLGAALFVVLSESYDEGVNNWAFAAIGSVAGYWLKPAGK